MDKKCSHCVTKLNADGFGQLTIFSSVTLLKLCFRQGSSKLLCWSGYYLNQASLFTLEVDLGVSQCRKGETNSSQTATIVMVIKQSLGSWSHMWSLGKVSGCGSTSLFGSHTGTHQGK